MDLLSHTSSDFSLISMPNLKESFGAKKYQPSFIEDNEDMYI